MFSRSVSLTSAFKRSRSRSSRDFARMRKILIKLNKPRDSTVFISKLFAVEGTESRSSCVVRIQIVLFRIIYFIYSKYTKVYS